jgi:hypothetical protein
MIRSILFVLSVASVLSVGCSSSQPTKTTASDTVKASKPSEPDYSGYKFSFFISASGSPTKAMDSWTMDTNGMMSVHTAHKTAKGDYRNIDALAQLDPPDYDTLRMMVIRGKLSEIDPKDLTEQCPGDELYKLGIVPLHQGTPLGINFSACAGDYNLLLNPQRKYFRMLLDWWERMRVKYRPVQAE